MSAGMRDMGRVLLASLLLVLTGLIAGTAKAQAPRLGMPVECRFGVDCFIQQYPDWDPGPGATDYRCGRQTYDGHGGTDIRTRDLNVMRRGVPVLAAADGVVVAVRDGLDDAIVMTDQRRAAIEGVYCGNGVVIAHGDGWRTQYCHLRQGSVTAIRGQPVRQGQRIGLVGSSGNSEFPHLEFLVYQGETKIDPFTGAAPGTGPCGSRGLNLWQVEAASTLGYQRGAIIGVGFATQAMTTIMAESPPPPPGADAPALVAYGHLINTEAGDVVEITLDGPAGRIAENRNVLERGQARRLIFSGRRRTEERWPAGRYVATLKLIRNGQITLMDHADLTLN